jgi:exosortase/archaeosortase family protein
MDSKKKVFFFIIYVFLALFLFYTLNFLPLEYPVVKLFYYLNLVDSNGFIAFESTNMLIDYECSGFFSIFIFIAILLSPLTNLNKKQKLIYGLLGSLILYLANILRLLFFFLFPSIFNLIHFTGWIIMSFLILILWYIINNKS